MKKNISYMELQCCQTYAERVLEDYRKNHGGENPMNADEAEGAIMHFNKKCRSFKSMFGIPIKSYIPTIIECIGLIVEGE